MADGDTAPLEVFYSYSHDDEEYRKKLGKHLTVLRRAGLITDWHDRDIDAGASWQEEIDRHLLSADIVLLLVSASFIASDYCWGDEITKALARHKEKKARVIPIILHPCGWLMTPLKELQGVPRDNKAISLWTNEHAAFDHVVTEIAKVVAGFTDQVQHLRFSRKASAGVLKPRHFLGVELMAQVSSSISRAL